LPDADASPTLGAQPPQTQRARRAQPMAIRPHPRSRPVVELRRAIDCLPLSTREAMLEGVLGDERIIVGAYVDGRGGVCPMLAAHRRGGRTNFLSFARAWDRFAGASRKARQATQRELAILAGQLENSLSREESVALAHAIDDHRRLARATAQAEADPAGEIAATRLPLSRSRQPAHALRSAGEAVGAGSGR
jgi:hypothetical protein